MGPQDRVHLTTSETPYRMGGRIPFYVATSAREVDVVVLANVMLGVEMHWASGRTRPCTRAGGFCGHCLANNPPDRWKGFLGSWDYRKARLCIAELTAEAVEQCPLFKTWSGQLRGKRLRLRRSGVAKNGLVIAELSEVRTGVGHLPPCFDVLEALYRAWNLEQKIGPDNFEESDPTTEGL